MEINEQYFKEALLHPRSHERGIVTLSNRRSIMIVYLLYIVLNGYSVWFSFFAYEPIHHMWWWMVALLNLLLVIAEGRYWTFNRREPYRDAIVHFRDESQHFMIKAGFCLVNLFFYSIVVFGYSHIWAMSVLVIAYLIAMIYNLRVATKYKEWIKLLYEAQQNVLIENQKIRDKQIKIHSIIDRVEEIKRQERVKKQNSRN